MSRNLGRDAVSGPKSEEKRPKNRVWSSSNAKKLMHAQNTLEKVKQNALYDQNLKNNVFLNYCIVLYTRYALQYFHWQKQQQQQYKQTNKQ